MADYEEKNELPGDKYPYESDYRSDLETHDRFIEEWDANEAMLISKTYDAVSKQTKNGITDSEAATMVIERSARVVGQLPSGTTEAAGKKDRGKAVLMDIIRQKWIYPNANAQRPFLDKLRLWEMYSGVYGLMPMYYDWDVAPNGYVGPNCWLWNPRNFVPQAGRSTIADMDYVHAISWMTEKEVKEIVDQLEEDEDFAETSGWILENMQTVLEAVKNSSKDMDSHRTSFVERNRNNTDIKGRAQVVTRFEAGEDGKWITFSPDWGSLQLRNIPNPHKNGKIPFVIKPAIPLLDSFYNLSEFARAKPIQFAKDGLTNFYFAGIKMNIYPPTVVNSQGIVKHTVSNEPGSIWEEIIPNSARRLETSTAGLNTYQAAMGMLNGSLQNVFGTTTTQANAESSMSPQFGKTPEALKYQAGRESARDNQNRAYLQTAIEQLMDGMFELIANMSTEPIDITLFADDVKEIKKAGYDDVLELLFPNESMQAGRLLINPEMLQGVSYRFNMKPDSTIKITKEEQKHSLLEFIGELSKHQNELDAIYKATGERINWKQIIDTYADLSDLPLEDIWIEGEPPQEEKENPLLQIIQAMKIEFEELPEDAKKQILESIGMQINDLSPKQQEIDIKKAEAAAKVMTAAQEPEPTAEPITPPKSLGGRIFRDETTQLAADDLDSLRQPARISAKERFLL
jgi:hypothetical protein